MIDKYTVKWPDKHYEIKGLIGVGKKDIICRKFTVLVGTFLISKVK